MNLTHKFEKSKLYLLEGLDTSGNQDNEIKTFCVFKSLPLNYKDLPQ